MLKSVTYEVLFRVRIKTEPGEVVCITGDCSELGNWNLYKGPRLRRETQCKAAPESVAQGACKNGQNGDVWAKKITFHGSINTHYRYYVARVYHDDDEDSVLVMRWETNIKPRKFSITEAMSICEPPLEDIAVFGEYDGHCHITNGWLTDQAQINIHLHGSPIKIWNAKLRDQQLSIKCTPLDHKYRDEHMNDEGETLPEAAQAIVSVVKLEHGQSKARCQGEYGIMYTQGSNISFKIQTLEPENTEGAIPTVKHIGYSFILPLEVHSSTDRRTVPITSLKHHPLVDYLLIKPLIGAQFSLEVTYQNYWKAREPLDIGHRGMGMLAATRENTIKSLQDAANHGADFVELDVHLTKDKQAIVYHDFKVQIAYRKNHNAHEQENYYDLNEFIDVILRVIFENHGGRRIVFTSFDCNSCIMLRLKQNRFPVLFLTQGDTDQYDLYRDKRTHSVIMATEFAIANDLLGVNVMSQLLLKDESLIDYVKSSGLLLWCWGEDNNNAFTINKLRQLKLDAIIYDSIFHGGFCKIVNNLLKDWDEPTLHKRPW
ncbi:GPCP1-like protein [Mya arenaria]|uniref:GPCP1-like protein n=1 Tax=Mya arenaria TaxID=6604 RepID=A0ABY7DR20_MYAAR|nr:GPCP1-like protein [Mya arenaria]